VQAVHLANLRIALSQLIAATEAPEQTWETDAAKILTLTIRAADLAEVRTVLKA
jgi:hypothetical protein